MKSPPLTGAVSPSWYYFPCKVSVDTNLKHKQRASMTSFDTIVDECAATATAQRKKVRRKRTRRSAAAEAPAEEEEAAGNEDESVTNEGAVNGNGGPDKRIWMNSDFWEYVDCLLADLRATAVANEQTAEGRKKYIEL
jgi:hypothetical protein